MKKKTTTILLVAAILVAVTLLTNCGNSNEVRELRSLVQSHEEEIQSLREEIVLLSERENVQSEDVSVSTQTSDETTTSSQETTATTAQTNESSPVTYTSDKEEIHVSVLHGENAGSATAYSKADEAGNNALKLEGNIKYVSFIISGVSVEKVELVDSSFNAITNIQFDVSTNQYLFEHCFGSYGKEIFLVTTKAGNQYYFSATF